MRFGFLERFHRDESGAVTVDWVVLTAGLVTFGAVMALLIGNSAKETAATVGERMANYEIPVQSIYGQPIEGNQ